MDPWAGRTLFATTATAAAAAAQPLVRPRSPSVNRPLAPSRRREEAQPMREAFQARERQTELETSAVKAERRKHPRAAMSLRGRYLLADRREYVCTMIDASVSAVAL